MERALNYPTLHRYLLFNYVPGQESFFRGIKKLRPGHVLKIKGNEVSIDRYWHLSYSQVRYQNEEDYRQELLELMKDAVRIRLLNNEMSAGAFLSGGMDSSSVVGLMSSMIRQPVHTFSFRCLGKSFDESGYARIVSDTYKTQHHENQFSPEDTAFIADTVKLMDEPFCDIGIEIASYILGRSAQGNVFYLLTGDGGDELFAGHPVYVADKVANIFTKIPRVIQKPVTQGLQFLPDTDKEKPGGKSKTGFLQFQFPGAIVQQPLAGLLHRGRA